MHKLYTSGIRFPIGYAGGTIVDISGHTVTTGTPQEGLALTLPTVSAEDFTWRKRQLCGTCVNIIYVYVNLLIHPSHGFHSPRRELMALVLILSWLKSYSRSHDEFSRTLGLEFHQLNSETNSNYAGFRTSTKTNTPSRRVRSRDVRVARDISNCRCCTQH